MRAYALFRTFLAVLIDSAITFNYFTKTCIKNQEKIIFAQNDSILNGNGGFLYLSLVS